MADRISAARAYVAAQRNRTDETIATLDPALADDVALRSAMGLVEGREAVLGAVGGAATAPMFAGASWGEPVTQGDTVRVTATMPPGSMMGGVDYTFEFDESDRISTIAAQIVPAPAPPATEVHLGPDIAATINGALANGTPVLVAYVDGEDRVHLSYRGTTQVLAPDRLALWARDPEGGLPRAVATRPKLTLLYRDMKTRTNYTFYGRARVTTDEPERAAVYDGSPEQERNFDPARRGAALIVDVDRVEGMGPAGRVNMQRAATPV
jgi:hypothetical protein